MRKIIITLSALLFLLIAGATGITIAYDSSGASTTERFPDNFYINGVDCSGLTLSAAEAKLSGARNSSTMTVMGEMGEVLDTYTDFGCTFDGAGELKSVRKAHLLRAALNHYLGMTFNAQIPLEITSFSEAFEADVKSSAFLNYGGETDSQDAYVDMSDRSFPIVAEVYGDKPDRNKYFKDVCHALSMGNMVFEYNRIKYVDAPRIKSDNEELLELRDFCQANLATEITYKLGEDTFTIPAEEQLKMLDADLSGNVDKAAVEEYVINLAYKYDTLGKDIKFTTPKGKTFKVTGGTYGWVIDVEKETQQLCKDLVSGKNITRAPIFIQKGEGTYSRNLNDTYVDVDITSQTVTYYREGEVKFQCSCVTGNQAAGHSTPTGVFRIVNKHRNLVLRGDNDDGTRYESPVKYWCGFYAASHGFHDADWRGSFGGTIYRYNGSHGCVNMPPNRMPEFFDKMEVGIPVIVHY